MSCDIIVKKIKLFLDDLLEEEDYQQVCRHLGQCVHCHTYAASIGSLSYRVHTLGDVSPPPDILSTVLYTLKKTPDHPSDAVVAGQVPAAATWPFWGVLLGVIVLFFGAVCFVFFWQKQKPAAPAAVSAPVAALPKPMTVFAPDPSPLPQAQGHFHLSASSRDELMEMLDQMELVVYYQASRLVIVNVPKQQAQEFVKQMGALNGVVQEFGEMDSGPASEDLVQISVYLE